MNSDDHARSVHAKLFAECREENAALRAALRRLHDMAMESADGDTDPGHTPEPTVWAFEVVEIVDAVLGGGNSQPGENLGDGSVADAGSVADGAQ